MKLFNFQVHKNKAPEKKAVSFAHLTKEEQKEALKKGAEKFSKYFAKSFEKLAKE